MYSNTNKNSRYESVIKTVKENYYSYGIHSFIDNYIGIVLNVRV